MLPSSISLDGNGQRYRALSYKHIGDMAGVFGQLFDKIKAWIAWSWTYLWALWFMLVVFVIYVLRGPLKIGDNFAHGKFKFAILPIIVNRPPQTSPSPVSFSASWTTLVASASTGCIIKAAADKHGHLI